MFCIICFDAVKAQQTAFEDTHLGNFRRIMPSATNHHYQKFYVQQNKLSVYSETAASKRREECAKQQRIELEEKFRHNQYILKQFRIGNGNVHGLNFCNLVRNCTGMKKAVMCCKCMELQFLIQLLTLLIDRV